MFKTKEQIIHYLYLEECSATPKIYEHWNQPNVHWVSKLRYENRSNINNREDGQLLL